MPMKPDKDDRNKQIEPDPSESEDDFMERCTSELIDAGMESGDAEAFCEVAWEERGNKASGIVRKTHTGSNNGMEFILSDESVDRMGDIISADGWQLANFRKNPVALAFHRSDFAIGKWKNLRVENKALRGYLELAPEG